MQIQFKSASFEDIATNALMHRGHPQIAESHCLKRIFKQRNVKDGCYHSKKQLLIWFI